MGDSILRIVLQRCGGFRDKKENMALFGSKQLNLIIGFDTIDNCLTVMRIVGNDISTCKVDYISVRPELIVCGEWAQIISEYLPEYIDNQHFDKTFAVYLMLPDRLVSTDVLTIPTLSSGKMADALQSQIEELYTFAPNYKFNKIMLASNKSNTTYELIMVNKDVLNSVYKALSGAKLYVKNATYAASGALDAVFALRPKTRKQSFLFLDIKNRSARITVCGNGSAIGWVEIPFGLNMLSSDKILIEANVVYNDVANIAVINATELAKKKKMTVMEDDDESVIEEAAITLNEINADKLPDEREYAEAGGVSDEEAEKAGSDAGKTEEKAAEIAGGATTAEVKTGDGSEAETVKAEAVKAEAAAALVAGGAATVSETVEPKEPPKPKVKTYVRKTKRLPAFMQRPTPETPEGFVVENFRAFVKRCLLVKMQNEQSGYLPVPSFVLVNMPEEFGYVIDEINKEEDNGIEFRYFDPSKEKNVSLTANLELYGALFAGAVNKVNTF